MVGSRCFLPGPPKIFLSKMERKLKGEIRLLNGRKCPCALVHGLSVHCSSSPFIDLFLGRFFSFLLCCLSFFWVVCHFFGFNWTSFLIRVFE